MSKYIYTIALTLSVGLLMGQSTWEEYTLPQEGYIKDSGAEGGFMSEGVFIANQYFDDPMFPFWTGWILGNGTDKTTAGNKNEHSCIAGEGYDGSSNFAITFASGSGSIMKFSSAIKDRLWNKFYVNNNTYAYLSMLEGDIFAKKFGGETGDDPDYFLMSVKGFYGGIISTDSITFYLADYRFEDNSKDYIINEWSEIDVSSFSGADSLQLSLTSSDTGALGMNTPAYICVDNIETDLFLSNDDIESIAFDAHSNNGLLTVDSEVKGDLAIYDLNGNLLRLDAIAAGMNTFNHNLSLGVYLLKFRSFDGIIKTEKALLK